MSLMKGLNKEKGAGQYVMPGIFLLFFVGLWAISPIGIYPDTGSYISMQPGREPLYPVFLWIFRRLFQEADTLEWLAASGQLDSDKARELIDTWPALHAATLVQSVFAAIGCLVLVWAIRKRFRLSPLLTGLIGICSLFPYVMTPLASSSHMVLNKAVLTEGLTFPLFYCFLGYLILAVFKDETEKDGVDKYAIERKQRMEEGFRSILVPYLPSFLFCILLVLTRNQMMVTFAVWITVLSWEVIRRRKPLWLVAVLASILCFTGVRSVVNQTYNSAVYNGYQGAETGSYNLLTTMLYLSEEEDVQYLDKEERTLFNEMWEQMREREMNRQYAGDGLLSRAYHYEDAYDVIGLEIQQPVLFGYAAKQGIPDERQLPYVVSITTDMVGRLMPHLMGAYVENYLATVASGLTRTISASGTIMGIYSVIAYTLAIILMLYLFAKKKIKAAGLMFLSLLLIAANVSATALMIMCLSRYMIYNTALFYIAFLLMLVELVHMRYNKQ